MTRKRKAARTKRRKIGSLMLTSRDYDLLVLVGLLRHASTEQIARELFPNRDRARRRLRRLFDAGLIDIVLVSSNRPNLISITRRGMDVLLCERPGLDGHLARPEPLKLQAVHHHLLVVDARLYASALGDKRGAPLVRWSAPGGSLHKELGLSSIPLVPDGLAEFKADDEQIVIAIEADCGTEPLAVLQDKFRRYRDVAAMGAVDALWFVVDAGRGRLRSIETLAKAADLGEWTRVLPCELLTMRPVCELPVRGDRANSPNTTIVADAENRKNSGTSDSEGRHG